MPHTPTMHLIAGVNGAGKTTFYREVLASATPGAEFVNADEIARARWPGAEAAHDAEAARIAIDRRRALFEARLTFVTETVFSHESKLDLILEAKRRGFLVLLIHIGLSTDELARARVATRVETGGHDVAPERIAARYARCQKLIPRAAAVADRTFVFDNSGGETQRSHTHVMTLVAGRITKLSAFVPAWVEEAYHAALAEFRSGLRLG